MLSHLSARQGCYSRDGDIVVLCAYLGQLARVRDALAGDVAVIIDERDQIALAQQEDDNDDAQDSISGVERIQVSKRVMNRTVIRNWAALLIVRWLQIRIRTVDNYQGEEAKVGSVGSIGSYH